MMSNSTEWYILRPKWIQDYLVDPLSTLTEEESESMIGGEAALWAEFVDGTNLFSLLYPRLCATAERLWAERSIRDPGMIHT